MPRRSARPAHVTTYGGGGGTAMVEWEGQKVYENIRQAHLDAMQRVAGRAERYWVNEEWTEGRHPYMTGDENSIRELGFFDVGFNEHDQVALQFGSTSEHTIFEEVGTSRQEAHHPIRNTLDKVAYGISDDLRRAAKRAGFE